MLPNAGQCGLLRIQNPVSGADNEKNDKALFNVANFVHARFSAFSAREALLKTLYICESPLCPFYSSSHFL